jgi:hypothetical protein
MDGVVADFASAFRDIECDLFGADTTDPAPNAPEEETEQTPNAWTCWCTPRVLPGNRA